MRNLTLSFGLIAATASTASAATLASDSFDYVLGTLITGQAGGSGWSGAWQTDADALPVSTVVEGLSFGLYPTSGNALQMDVGQLANDNLGFAGRAVSGGPSGDTLFMSYLVQQTRDEGLPFGDGQDTFFGHSVAGNIDNSISNQGKFNGQVSGSNGFGGPEGVDVAIGKLGSDGGDGRTSFVMPQDTTLMAIYAFDPVGVPDFQQSGNPLEATLWILDADDYAAVDAAGGDIAALDANNQVKTVEPSTIGNFGTPDLNSGDLFRFFVQDAAVTYDELLIGQTLRDVLPTAVPEPSALAAVGLMGLLGMRRRR
jgi:hypothetical protein